MSDGRNPVHFLGVHDSAAEATRREAEERAELLELIPEDIARRLLLLLYDLGLVEVTKLLNMAAYSLFGQILSIHLSPISSLSICPQLTVEELPPSILAAVALLTQDFAVFDDVLCIQTAYGNVPRTKLRDIINSSMHKQSARPTLSSLQCALLIAIAPPDHGLMPENELVSTETASTAAMANSLDFQYDPSDRNISPAEKALRRRLSCLVYSNDIWVAAASGRSSFIPRDNWLVETAHAVELCLSEADAKHFEDFAHFTKLSSILGSLLHDV